MCLKYYFVRKNYGEREDLRPEEFFKFFGDFAIQVKCAIDDIEKMRLKDEKDHAKKHEKVYCSYIFYLHVIG